MFSYVLRGSCGLEYELMLTEEGKQRRYSNSDYNYHRSRYQNDYSSYDDSDYTIVGMYLTEVFYK